VVPSKFPFLPPTSFLIHSRAIHPYAQPQVLSRLQTHPLMGVVQPAEITDVPEEGAEVEQLLSIDTEEPAPDAEAEQKDGGSKQAEETAEEAPFSIASAAMALEGGDGAGPSVAGLATMDLAFQSSDAQLSPAAPVNVRDSGKKMVKAKLPSRNEGPSFARCVHVPACVLCYGGSKQRDNIHKDRHADRHTDRHTHTRTDTQTHRETNAYTDRLIDTQTHNHREKFTDTQTHRHTDT
jgi:hypothetical protein